MRVRFGSCVLDSAAHEVRREGVTQHISPKAFMLLEFLLERRPAVVTKVELHDRLWPRTHVSESSLTRLVSEVRGALGEGAGRTSFLRTVHGLGYAFSGVALEEALPSHRGPSGFHVLMGNREIPLAEGSNILGRADDAAILVPSTKASRRHARIVIAGPQATIEDLESKNGTYLRGQRLMGSAPVGDGDEIVIGPVLIIFRAASSTSTETDSSLAPPAGQTSRAPSR